MKAKNKTPRELVLDEYPNAYSIWNEAFQIWYIMSGIEILGRGISKSAAWTAAYKNVYSMKTKTSDALKSCGLTDDQILNIALCESLFDSANMLKALILDKWILTTLEACQVVKRLKEELK